MNQDDIQKRTGALVRELTADVQERIRRASAPTLRDLDAVATELEEEHRRVATADQPQAKTRRLPWHS